MFVAQLAPTIERIEGFLSRQPAHLDQPIDDSPLAAKSKSTVGQPLDRSNSQIDIVCQPPIQAHFIAASRLSRGHRCKVEKVITDPPLQLVGKLAGQKHDRNMGFNGLHALGPMWVGARLGKPADNVVKFAVEHLRVPVKMLPGWTGYAKLYWLLHDDPKRTFEPFHAARNVLPRSILLWGTARFALRRQA